MDKYKNGKNITAIIQIFKQMNTSRDDDRKYTMVQMPKAFAMQHQSNQNEMKKYAATLSII